jgi:hypothetical protein
MMHSEDDHAPTSTMPVIERTPLDRKPSDLPATPADRRDTEPETRQRQRETEDAPRERRPG